MVLSCKKESSTHYNWKVHCEAKMFEWRNRTASTASLVWETTLMYISKALHDKSVNLQTKNVSLVDDGWLNSLTKRRTMSHQAPKSHAKTSREELFSMNIWYDIRIDCIIHETVTNQNGRASWVSTWGGVQNCQGMTFSLRIFRNSFRRVYQKLFLQKPSSPSTLRRCYQCFCDGNTFAAPMVSEVWKRSIKLWVYNSLPRFVY